jgi:phosphoribosylamine--glycine ligase
MSACAPFSCRPCAMCSEGRPFKGCLYFGLMLTGDGPKVIECNSRFGDPETQVVLPRLKTDLVDIFEAVADGTLSQLDIRWDTRAAACVVAASGGYPGKYPKGLEITGIADAQALEDVTVYHAGTKLDSGRYYTAGGRVLGVTALAGTLDEALKKAYEGIGLIRFDGMQYRRDIGR